MDTKMNTKQHNKYANCTRYQETLPELVFDPSHAAADLKAHVAGCDLCHETLLSLQATLSAMDSWTAPELTPYFDVRMAARLREARAAAPAGWFEQLRTRVLYLSNIQVRPMLAGALATIIMIGGGTYAGLSPAPVAPSAAVADLHMMDKNDQALSQMDQLLQADNDTGSVVNPSLNP
jgi:hypothetical protein